MIQIRPVDAQDEEVWRSLLELRERYPEGWTLIGARMVTLLAFEQDRTPPRLSLGADALINVRLIPRGTQRFSKLLLELDYELVDVSGFGHGHRCELEPRDEKTPQARGGAPDSRPQHSLYLA